MFLIIFNSYFYGFCGVFKLLFYYLKVTGFDISVHCFHGLWLIVGCFLVCFQFRTHLQTSTIYGNPRHGRLSTYSSASAQVVSLRGSGGINLNVATDSLTDSRLRKKNQIPVVSLDWRAVVCFFKSTPDFQ